MRRSLTVLCTGLLMVSGSAFAFDYSPTQTKVRVDRIAPAAISQNVVDGVLADAALVKGTDLLVATPDGSRVDSIQGSLSDPLSGDLGKATRDFIVTHGKLFNVPANRGEGTLKMVKAEETAGANHFYYQMVIDGVPVQDSVIDLHVGKDRRIQLANGSFPTVKEITNQISINRIDAIASAKRALNAKTVRCAPKADMVVVAEKGTGRMAFNVKIATSNPMGDWEVLIDAETGKEISRLNQMVFVDEFEGTGNVYLHSPLKGSDSVEVLPHLSVQGKLIGLYAEAVNEDTAGSFNASNSHIYAPDNTHFDEAMIYYHVTKIHDYFKKLGHNKMDHSMKANVHVGDKYDNAYYSPMEDAMSFGDGNRFNDLAKEDVVAYHEYSHAALNPIVSLNYSKESGAINEGQADYFACSFTDNPKLGEYVVQKMGKDCLRNLVNNLQYPKDITNEVHADGRIWGAVLWDLRGALGAEVSDLLISKSFYYLKPGSPKFANGLSAIITADKNLYEGKNKATILEVFQKRGIAPASLDSNSLNSSDLKRMQTFRSIHGK